MRRAQSVRHYARSSLALAVDDLGTLKEGDESNEDVLRRQLLDKDRENDKLLTQLQTLQVQLSERPPVEKVQELEKEYKNLDLILQGTQRENERCMAELDRARKREKMLEREIAKLAGENWQSSLDIAPSTNTNRFHQRSATISSSPILTSSLLSNSSPTPTSTEQPNRQAMLAHVEQVRLLILGMEQRLQTREEKLTKTMEKAESESRRFEELQQELATRL